MEHEITGHSRKIYKISKNKSMPFWKKVKEIAIEVGIIVFAVSLAAFLERTREHSNEQAAVKEFLVGLKVDLLGDIQEMTEDKKSFTGSGGAFNYLYNLKKSQSINKDSIRKYERYYSNSTGLIANDGRFEGFKSSGRIITIENKELQNDIMDLYQEDIPSLLASTNAYTKRKEFYWQFIMENKKWTSDSSTNMLELMASDKSKAISESLLFADEIIDRYDSCIVKAKKIIATIDKEYKE